jgi:hypothetical protein
MKWMISDPITLAEKDACPFFDSDNAVEAVLRTAPSENHVTVFDSNSGEPQESRSRSRTRPSSSILYFVEDDFEY